MPTEPSDAPTVGETDASRSTPRSIPLSQIDAEGAAEGRSATAERRRRRRPARDWREGGSTVRRWGYDLLGWTMLSFGAGILGSSALSTLAPTLGGGLIAPLVMWAGMLVPIVLAFSRSRPRMLLRFRWVDLLYGVVLGGALRVVQGWLDVAAGASGAFPSYPTVNGSLTPDWWFTEALTPVIIGPTIEELFFRGVLLVAIFTVVRRAFGKGFAAFIALVVTTGVFVLAHGISGAVGWDDAVVFTLVGLVVGLLVLLTGRIWGALLVHMVFNGTYVLLALTGTLLA
ncbi:CPBP family intramembrane glutamic endopeptidase [Microbacterium lacus]|uniref:CPBP family intramembrane glutamic endopeptidase n=1 Tax=Microbacterium lacus TaxID=415217 RepID=UPI0012FE4F66|nr:CPBP family intramembrane glutamic endopeptidase [Microbacterium lacus]